MRMPERVTIREVGSLSAESTRFPGEGQSAQGQSGPKARPKGVADGQRVNIPAPRMKVEIDGDAGIHRVGALDTPVPQGRQLDLEARNISGHEKPSKDDMRGPYRNPTQVC